MFCPECGSPGGGKFCVNCGTRLAPPAVATTAAEPADVLPPVDWSREIRHEVLIAHPEVRALLKTATKQGGARLSGEQLIKFHDKYLAKFSYGIAIGDVAAIAGPALTRLGMQTGKQRSETVAHPIGHAIVATLCALATRGIAVEDVEQATDGCVLEATLPPDLLVYQGTVVVTLSTQGDRTRIDALTKIGGQLFDWGKSTRLLDGLLADIRAFRP